MFSHIFILLVFILNMIHCCLLNNHQVCSASVMYFFITIYFTLSIVDTSDAFPPPLCIMWPCASLSTHCPTNSISVKIFSSACMSAAPKLSQKHFHFILCNFHNQSSNIVVCYEINIVAPIPVSIVQHIFTYKTRCHRSFVRQLLWYY